MKQVVDVTVTVLLIWLGGRFRAWRLMTRWFRRDVTQLDLILRGISYQSWLLIINWQIWTCRLLLSNTVIYVSYSNPSNALDTN